MKFYFALRPVELLMLVVFSALSMTLIPAPFCWAAYAAVFFTAVLRQRHNIRKYKLRLR